MAKLNAHTSANSTPEAPGRAGANSNIITTWPVKENALIVKLVCDPTFDNGKKTYRPANFFTHPTGTKQNDKGRHVCQTFFGAKSSPENDKFWELMKEYSALKKAGQGESVEGKRANAMFKTFKPSKKGYVLAVQPNSKAVLAVRIPESVIDMLMGRKADNYNKTEIVSLINTLGAKGLSPFDLNNTKGWLKFYKSGDGLNTKYHVEQALVEREDETKDGRKIKYMDDFVGAVHTHLLSDEFDTSEIPNVIEFEKRWSFTVDESVAFVNGMGTLEATPERFKRNGNQGVSSAQEPVDESEPTSSSAPAEYQTVSEEDIPF